MSPVTRQRALHAYEQATETIPPLRQIVMLYDGVLRRVEEARRAIGEGRIEDRYHALERAIAIFDALQNCLDFEHGGEVAQHLNRFYTYVIWRMHQINIRNDVAICDEVLKLVRQMRESWAAVERGGSCAPAVPVGADRPEAAGGVRISS